MPLASSIAVHRFDSAAEGGDLIERALVRHAPHRPAPPPVPTRPLAQRVWQSYVPSQGAQLRVQQCGCGPARAAVVQHDAYSSLRACRRLVGDLGVDRPALAIELPGHGETAWVEGCDADGLSSVASLVRGALQSLGATDCDLIGWGAGAALQVELARGRPALAASLTLIAAVDVSLDPPLQTALLASYSAPPAVSYGGHLLRAWHEVRDHLLFFPWYERRRRWALEGPPRLEPEFLQARTVDAVLAGGAGVALRQAELRYPLRSRLREQPRAARHAAPSWEPRCAHSCGLAGSSGAFAALSRDPEHWIATLKSLMQSEPP
jgi:pimeloyl-ACP methyl ester carboxylesterase